MLQFGNYAIDNNLRIKTSSYNSSTGYYTFTISGWGIWTLEVGMSVSIYVANKALSFSAHAEGEATTAAGRASHAEGFKTIANSDYAHAEGNNTYCSGSSHAEGFYTTASASGVHAEGGYTSASGNYAHVEGLGTANKNRGQHVQGEYNILDNNGNIYERGTYAHIIGNGTADDARSNAHTVDWSGNAWYAGDIYVGSTSGTNKDAGSKKLATEDYVTTRGYVTTDTKNTAGSTDSSSKLYLIGATSQTASSQTYSQDTAYVGTDGKLYSNSKEVVNLSDTQALTNKTYNGYTLAAASAKAVDTSISAGSSSANLPTSAAVATFVEGKGYVTTDTKNTAGSTDTFDKIYLIGATSQATNPQTYSDDEVFVKNGVLNAQELTIGSRADDTPIGTGSSAQGYNITATGSYSHAEGASTTASEMWAHAEGNHTTASGFAAHAEGERTGAYNSSCHAEGIYSTASGSAAHAEGENTEASGNTSHAEGQHTKAQRKSQHVQGEYNIVDIAGTTTTRGTYAHIVGNGTSNSTRSNAHTLAWDGTAWFQGDVYVGSTSGTNKDAGSKKLATEDYVGATITNDKNVANGIAGLDSNSKISNSQISTIATSAIVAMFE